MLPWNFLISISAFWNFKFRQVSNETAINHTTFGSERAAAELSYFNSFTVLPVVPTPIIKPTDMQIAFPSYVAIASNIPGAITTLLHSGFGQRVSVCTRMGWALTLLTVGFSCLLAISIPNCDLWQERYLHIGIHQCTVGNIDKYWLITNPILTPCFGDFSFLAPFL